jgi:hypothetical protein
MDIDARQIEMKATFAVPSVSISATKTTASIVGFYARDNRKLWLAIGILLFSTVVSSAVGLVNPLVGLGASLAIGAVGLFAPTWKPLIPGKKTVQSN